MLKQKMIRKIIVASCALFALLLLYLVPNKEAKLKVSENLEYTPSISTSSIYLLDDYNYLGKTEVVINNTDIEEKIKESLNVLINGGTLENRIPNGFKAIIPSDTKILSVKYEDGLAKIDFSKEILDIDISLEEKMIEAIVYTATSIDEVDKVIIYVEGDILSKLPKTKINLPSTLDRSFGINKVYDFTKTDDINQVTIYYLKKNNDDFYYIPVTKYLNDSRDKIKIIIDELTSYNTYNTNLMSYLNSNTELLAIEEQENILELTFNSYIFSDVSDKEILEEVIYTICLSVKDNYDVDEVVIKNEEEPVITTVLNELN
jgi:germination protein M